MENLYIYTTERYITVWKALPESGGFPHHIPTSFGNKISNNICNVFCFPSGYIIRIPNSCLLGSNITGTIGYTCSPNRIISLEG